MKPTGSYQWMRGHAYDAAPTPRRFGGKQIQGPELVPAQISGEDVEQLTSVYQRVEDGAVRTVDHVALF